MGASFSNKHAVYQTREPIWRYNTDHYAGGRTLVDAGSYLHKFRFEDTASFALRMGRSAGLYENLLARAIGVYISHVFRREASRKLPPALEAISKDVDLYGTRAGDFFRGVSELSMLHGLSFVLVDAPLLSGVTTEAEAQERRLRPWLELIPATKLIDWDIETSDPASRGSLRYAVIEDTIIKGKNPFSPGRPVKRYRLWTPDIWQVAEEEDGKDGAIVAQGPNRVGRVPLIPCYDRQLAPFDGATIMDDVASKANALWNRSSVRDEAFYFQGFSQLVITSDDKTLGELKLGVERAIKLNKGDTAEFIAPEASIFDAYKDFMREIAESVADLVFARTHSQLPSKQVETAEKRDIDRAEFMALLHGKSRSIETCEQQAWQLVAQYLGSTAEAAATSVTIAYPRDFRVAELAAAEWVEMVTNSIESRVDWRLSRHPEETREQAEEKIRENRKLEDELDPIERRQEQMSDFVRSAIGKLGPNAGGADAEEPKPDDEDSAE